MNHSYPGNIRELENIIEHAVAVAGKNILTEEDLPQHVTGRRRKIPLVFEKNAPEEAEALF